MAIRNFAKCLSAAALAVACTVHDPEMQAPMNSEPVSSDVSAAVLNARFDDALIAQIEEGSLSLEDWGIESVERIFPDAGRYEARSREAGLHRYYSVRFRREVPVTRAAAALEELPGVLSVNPRRKARMRAAFNDPYLSKQWHLVNGKTPSADIGVSEVWERYTKGSETVVVAVVDECVDPGHPDIKANLWNDGEGHTGRNFVRSSWDLSVRTGDVGHGTHVAGIVSAVNNNGLGVSSIAGGDAALGIQGVKLMSCAIFSGYASADDDAVAQAIKWSADHGAVISQNSWGYSADLNNDGRITAAELAEYKSWTFDQRDPVRGAIDYFIRYAGCDENGIQRADSPMKGGLVIFAAGNENIDWDYIGSQHDGVIAVGAFGMNGNKASYSNYGSWVDVAAPGGDASSRDDVIWSTVPSLLSSTGYEGIDRDGYAWVGTSMACPHVSGVAALLVSYFGGPGFTADHCREMLLEGLGDAVGGTRPIGRRLDAKGAFEYGFLSGLDPEEEAPQILLSKEEVEVKAHERAELTVRAFSAREEVTLRCEPGSSALRFDAATGTITIVGSDAAAGRYEALFTAVGKDSGKTTEATLCYTLLPNHAPVCKAVPENLFFEKLKVNRTLNVSDIFTDADGETLLCTAKVAPEGVVDVLCGGEYIFVSAAGYGIADVELTASDALGESVTVRLKAAVADPDQPVSLYPSVVSTDAYLSVGRVTPVTLQASVYSALGSLVMQTSGSASAFYPLHMDVSSLAPGRYTVEVAFQGISHRVRMIKY